MGVSATAATTAHVFKEAGTALLSCQLSSVPQTVEQFRIVSEFPQRTLTYVPSAEGNKRTGPDLAVRLNIA